MSDPKPLRGLNFVVNPALSSLRSDIPKGEVLALTAHAGTSFLTFLFLECA